MQPLKRLRPRPVSGALQAQRNRLWFPREFCTGAQVQTGSCGLQGRSDHNSITPDHQVRALHSMVMTKVLAARMLRPAAPALSVLRV